MNPTMVVLYTFLVSFILVILFKVTSNSLQAKRLPPGPPRLPIIGNLHQLGNPFHKSIRQLSKKHGDLMYLQLGSVPAIVVSSAQAVREIFKTHDAIFSGRPETYAAKKIFYNCQSISFAAYGDYWREIRKITISELLSAKRVKSFQAIRSEEVSSMINYVAKLSPTGPVNLSEVTIALSNNVLCRLAFGKRFNTGSLGKNKLRDMLGEAQDLLVTPCLSDYFPSLEWVNRFTGLESRVDKTVRDLDEIFSKIVEEHLDPTWSNPDKEDEDLVDVFLRAHKDPTQVVPITKDCVKGVIADLYFAGTDTSAAALVWIMALLIKSPHVLQKAQNEVRGFMKGREEVQEGDLANLTYLNLILKESLRLHPPAPLLVPRETIEECEIKGYKIPSRTRVFIDANSISMDPQTWENPHEFRPERFQDSPVDFRGQYYELIPFGIGRRGCPGMNFAIQLVKLALANLLRFDWELPHGMRADDLDMEGANGITMHKKTPLCLVATLVKS